MPGRLTIRNRTDGVPARAVPHFDAGSGDEIPIRDFDSTGAGWLPTDTRSSHNQCLLLLGTDGDHPDQWLRAGEALEHVWLEIARHGFVMSPLTQVVEVPAVRAELRSELRTVDVSAHPHAGRPRRPHCRRRASPPVRPVDRGPAGTVTWHGLVERVAPVTPPYPVSING